MTKKTNLKKHLLTGVSAVAFGTFAASGAQAAVNTLDATASNFTTASTDVNNVTGTPATVTLSVSKTMTDTAAVTLTGTGNFTFSDGAATAITLSGGTAGQGIVTAGATAGTVTIGAGEIVTAAATVDAMQVITANTLTAIVNAGSLNGVTSGDGLEIAGTGVVTTITNTGTFNSATAGAGINLSGGAAAAIVTLNNIAGLISATTTGNGIALASTAGITTVNNTGTIRAIAGTGAGILMAGTGTIATLNNTAGLIEGGSTSGAGFGINMTGASTITALTNTGTIRATTGGAAGIRVSSGANITTLTNTGLINDAAAGVALSYIGTSAGTINNNAGGTISATGAGTGVNFAGAYTGSLINAGTISAGATGTGINVATGGSLTTLTNSGAISAATTGTALNMAGGGVITTFTNTSTGTLSAAASTGGVIGLRGTGAITTFNNSGLVADSGDGYAIYADAITTATAINNKTGGILRSAATTATKGTINSTGASSILVTITNDAGGLISNTGTAATMSNAGRAIYIGGGGALGAIVNAGTISAATSAGVAIDASASAVASALTLTNTGLITGDVKMSNGVSTFNMNAVNTSSTGTTVGLNGNIVTSGTTTQNAINFNQGAAATQYYGGTITGTAGLGAVTAQTGTTYLTSNTVSTTTSTGGLAINTLTVNNGATLNLASATAGGSVAANAQARVAGLISVAAGGTLGVGAYNTLTGAAAFTNAGTLTIGVVGGTAGTYGRVAGTAVTPGTVTIDASSMGFVATATTLSSVLSGTSLVGFTAGALTDNSYVYSFASVLNGTNVDVLVTRANTLASAGTTTNDSSVGGALETIGLAGDTGLDTVVNAINASTTASQADSSLATLTPTTQTSGATSQAMVAVQDVALGTVENRMETARNESSGRGVATGNGTSRNGVWGQVFGSKIEQDNREGVTGYDADIAGLSLGADTQVNNEMRVGAAFSYGSTDAEGTANEVQVDSYQGALYATRDMGKIYLEGIAAFTYNNYESSRTLFGGNGVASADFDGQQYSAKATAGYNVDTQSGFKVLPFISAQYTFLTQDDYTETGSNAPLAVSTDDMNIFKTGLGAKLAYPVKDGGITYNPHVSGAWYYDWVGDEVDTTSNFVGAAGTSFISKGADIEKSSFRLGAGLDVLAQDNVTVSLDYNWDTKEDFDAHTGQLKARFEF